MRPRAVSAGSTIGAVLGTLLLTGALLLTGCANRILGQPVPTRPPAPDRALIAGYVAAANAAAADGSAAQQRWFASTQHPDSGKLRCALQGLTLTIEPAYRTLHTDPGWHPPQADRPPSGTVYAIAVTVTVQRGITVLGDQIGVLHIVLLDGTAYGFAPCPA